MHAVAEVLSRPSVDWAQAVEEYRPWMPKESPEFDSYCETYAEPYMDRVAEDEEFQTLFSGIKPELAVWLLSHTGVHSGDFLYVAKRQDPWLLDAIVRNKTACFITGQTMLPEREPEWTEPDPTEEETISFGKVLLIRRTLGQDLSDWPHDVSRSIAEHSMTELVQAIGEYWAVIEYPKIEAMVDDLLSEPDLASKFYEAVLGYVPPLAGTAYRFNRGIGRTIAMDYRPGRAKDLQKKLFSHPSQDETFQLLDSLVGRTYVGPNLYRTVRDRLSAGESSESVADELRQQVNRLGRLAVSPEFLTEQVSYSLGQNELLRSVLRWHEFDFGTGDLDNLLSTLDQLRQLPEDRLSSRYQPSGFVEIDRAAPTKLSLTEDMADRLQQLYSAHFDGYMNGDHGQRDYLMTKLEERIGSMLDSLAEKVTERYEAASTADRQKIAFQIDQLRQARDYDYREFPRGISLLARYKQHFHKELTTMLLVDVPFEGRDYHNVRDPDEGTEAITAIMENILHNGVSKLLETPGLSKQDKRAIKDLLSMRAFEPLFEQEQSDQPPVKLSFVPVRGILLEASGYIGKACWAEKGIISRDRDNIDGLVFVEQSGSDETPVEKLVGACVLIRTTANDGQPLLIVRGLNPSDQLLSKVNIADFYTQLTNYVQTLAESDGRQAAIVVDERVGRATTNRPRLFNFLNRQLINPGRSGLNRVEVPEEETTFNGYDITNHTYVLA